ncbi:uncharacterized protein LOC144125595 [Amblyomma americanum]
MERPCPAVAPYEGAVFPVYSAGFLFTVPEPVPADHLIDILEEVVGGMTYLQHLGGLRFLAAMASMAQVSNTLARGSLLIAGKDVPLEQMGVPVVDVTVYRLPPCVSDADLIAAFTPHGKAFLSRNRIGNGTRLVKLEMTKSPPNFLTVAETRAMIEYRGMRRVCSRCGGEGHFGAACKSVRCGRCGAYGHVGADCRPVCKRCGGAHPTPDCIRPRSYAAAVASAAAKAPQEPGDEPRLSESSQAAGAVSSGAAEEAVTSLAEPAVQRDDAVTSPADDQAGKELASSSSSQSAAEQTEGTSDAEKSASVDSDDSLGDSSLEEPPSLDACLLDVPTAAQHYDTEADTESPASPSPSDDLHTPVNDAQGSDSSSEPRPQAPHIPVALPPRGPCVAKVRAGARKVHDLEDPKRQLSSSSEGNAPSSATSAPKKARTADDDDDVLMDVTGNE